MRLLLIFFYFLPSFCYSQSTGINGSFIIAAICKDGILIAEDTRAAISNSGKIDDRLIIDIYYDTIQKIHPIKKFAFGSVGQLLFNNRFMFSYLKEFETLLSDTANVIDAQDNFLQYVYVNYNSLLPDFLKVKLIYVGYDNGVPTLCKTENKRWDCITNEGLLTTDTLANFDKIYNSKLTCKEMAGKVEKCIKDYAKKYNKYETIGGPIMILQIKPDNTFYWLKNEPKVEQLENGKQLFQAYKKGKLNIHFKNKEAKEYFEKYYGQF